MYEMLGVQKRKYERHQRRVYMGVGQRASPIC